MRYLILISIILSGCGTFVPVKDVSKISPEIKQKAYQVQIFTVDGKSHPKVKTYLGDIVAYSCKHLMWDAPASKGNALLQLRLKALDIKASAIIDVTFDSRGTDAFGTNCWESVQASGVAVKF